MQRARLRERQQGISLSVSVYVCVCGGGSINLIERLLGRGTCSCKAEGMRF